MKCLRQLLSLSWTHKWTNEWVLQKTNTERRFLKSVIRRKLGFFGHIMKTHGNWLQKKMTEDTLPESQQGEDLEQHDWVMRSHEFKTGLTLEEAVRATEDRTTWVEDCSWYGQSSNSRRRLKDITGHNSPDLNPLDCMGILRERANRTPSDVNELKQSLRSTRTGRQ